MERKITVADQPTPAEPAGDDRTFRQIGTDILVRLARIEGMLDGFLIAQGKRPDAHTTQKETP